MSVRQLVSALTLALIATGCASATVADPAAAPAGPAVEAARLSTHTPPPAPPTLAPTSSPPPGPTPTLGPDDWQDLPVVPAVAEAMQAVYRLGLANGARPEAFGKIGDCEATPSWFLGDFDRDLPLYRLGEHTDLLPVIERFQGSFDRLSVAVGRGFTTASVLTPWWADPAQCLAGETPLECELRIQRPSIAFVMLGTNDRFRQDRFEPELRRILELLLAQGVVPILSTKADNLEGDGSINATIARLALEYQVPLWNYWRAVQPLPAHGLQDDGVHLTWAPNHFDDPLALRAAWPVRNLTALQALDAVWQAVAGPASPGG